jgi:hypothetical protein
MKTCVLDKDAIHDVVEDQAEKLGLKDIAAQILEIRDALMQGLTDRQRALLRQLDDGITSEGTARVNAALMVACGCPACLRADATQEPSPVAPGTLLAAA